ncbi:hypothetical protein CITRIK5_30011 [Citricoccus sp. K5]|nr:hypothetical protein CITRIK5_30011 [Citricoccus sp. K5]
MALGSTLGLGLLEGFGHVLPAVGLAVNDGPTVVALPVRLAGGRFELVSHGQSPLGHSKRPLDRNLRASGLLVFYVFVLGVRIAPRPGSVSLAPTSRPSPSQLPPRPLSGAWRRG